MIFQYTHEQIMNGKKTQTRRLFKEGDYGWVCGETDAGRLRYSQVSNQIGEKIFNRWTVGRTYAVQPGRGQKAIGRIHVIDIRREDVRNISHEDAKAEGFVDRSHFMLAWCNMHDKKLNLLWYDCFHWEQGGEWHEGIEEFYEYLKTRPNELYKAWVITFEVLRDK